MDKSVTHQEKKPISSLSMDLDNLWAYMKTNGNPEGKRLPSYFGIFLPSFLDLLDEFQLKITFFIVGQDAALNENRELLSQITKRGHEVGNHSFHHAPLNILSREQIKREITDTERNIIDISGQKPLGFRGPGFTWNKHLLDILNENDYVYDASVLPTYIGPLARWYYFRNSHLTHKGKKQNKDIFGHLKDGLRPVKPYYWRFNSGSRLLEIPVTTIPFLRIPFHLSYLLYLSCFSESLMLTYLNMAIAFCKTAKIGPSFLLHPIDLIGGDQVSNLSFFPGMSLSHEQKTKLFRIVIKTLRKHFKLVNMSTYAEYLIENKKLKSCCLEPVSCDTLGQQL